MKTKFQSLFIAFAMILASSSLVMAQPNGAGPQGPPDHPRFVDIIPDVTADQEAEIEVFRVIMMQNTTSLEAELQIKEAELKALMASDASLTDKDAKLVEIRDLKYKIRVERITFHDNVRNILTDDQKTVFDYWTLNHNSRSQGHNRGNRGNNRQNNGQMRGNNRNR